MTPVEIKQIMAKDTWLLRQQVLWPEKALDFVKIPDDDQGLHFGLYVEGHLVSVVSVFLKDNTALFRKFATVEHLQGLGYGSALLQFVFQKMRALGATSIWCNAREDKCGFYEKFDMIKTPERFVKEGIPYVVMRREL